MCKLFPLKHMLFLALFFMTIGSLPSQAEDRQIQKDSWEGIGHLATKSDIDPWDIDVSPNGAGLPLGAGSVQQGRQLFLQKCAICHGQTGIEGPKNKLVGGKGTLKTPSPQKTVGSYWPYATTVYDYIYRAMPFTQPQSLTPDEVYSLVAWLLYQNEIIGEHDVINRETLPSVIMPNHDGFISDPRPEPPNR